MSQNLFVNQQDFCWLITGGSGFIGTALTHALVSTGHRVVIYTRYPEKLRDRLFNLGSHVSIVASLNELSSYEIDVVVNLAGAPVIGYPWTNRRRKVLIQSRYQLTKSLVEWSLKQRRSPQLWLQGSAIGYYGNSETADTQEDASPGVGFASELCAGWEGLLQPLLGSITRVCILRMGVVLAKDGGAFPLMSLPYRVGLGSILGQGKQYFSWVHIDDVIGVMSYLFYKYTLSKIIFSQQPQKHKDVAIYNLVSPDLITYSEFAHAIAAQLGRPLWLRVPRWFMEFFLGEMATMLTKGPSVMPHRLIEEGYSWKRPYLSNTLPQLFY